MILVDGEKYACEQCIRGHRSSSCKHIKRTLVLVRSRGRPSTDSFQRIAIYAEELKNKDEIDLALKNEDNSKNNFLVAKMVGGIEAENPSKSCCDKPTEPFNIPTQTEPVSKCCSGKKTIPFQKKETIESKKVPSTSCSCCPSKSADQPCKSSNKSVYILKAAKRHVFNVEKDSLRLLDPVAEVPNSKVGLDIIHKVSKNRKLQSCRHRTFKKEYLPDLSARQTGSSCCSNKANPENNRIQANIDGLTFNNQLNIIGSNNSTNTRAVGQPLNMNEPIGDPNSGSFIQFKVSIDKSKNTATTNSDTNKIDTIITNLHQSLGGNNNSTVNNDESAANANAFLYDLYVADSCTVPGSCACEPDRCACPDCTEHGKYKNSNLSVKEQFNDFQFLSNNDHVKSVGKVEIQSSGIPQFEQNFIQMLNEYSVESTNGLSPVNAEDNCICEPDRCCCFNCAQHGITDGVRKDGTFAGIPPFEIQLTGMQYPIDTPSSSISTPTDQSDYSATSAMYPVTERDRWLQQHELQFLETNGSTDHDDST